MYPGATTTRARATSTVGNGSVTRRVRRTVCPYDVCDFYRFDRGAEVRRDTATTTMRATTTPRCRARGEVVEHGARAPLRATCATLVEGARALPVRRTNE